MKLHKTRSLSLFCAGVDHVSLPLLAFSGWDHYNRAIFLLPGGHRIIAIFFDWPLCWVAPLLNAIMEQCS